MKLSVISFFKNAVSKWVICLLPAFAAFSYNGLAQTDTLKKHWHFELSFGQSLLFISNSDQITVRNESHIIVPTSSFLFFAEFRSDKKLRIPVFFNLPTESKQFIVNNELINEKASSSIGTGLQFKLFQIKIDSKSKIEMEAGPMFSLILDKSNSQLVPLLAARLRIMRGENFVMYLGVSYAFGVNTMGLFYGTGTVF